jgi:hypothetical protein
LDYSIDTERVINWGNSQLSLSSPIDVFGNRLKSVFRSANKKIMFDLLAHLGTVPVITNENKDNFNHGCFVHVDPTGHNGSGIIYKEEVEYTDTLTTAKIKGDEYRCYFAYGFTSNIYKKVFLDEGRPVSEIHNNHNGWGYLGNPTELNDIIGLEDVIRKYTIKAASALELNYGAVDFIVEEGTNLVYILETNSAPTLIEYSLTLFFAEQIKNNIYPDKEEN